MNKNHKKNRRMKNYYAVLGITDEDKKIVFRRIYKSSKKEI